MIDLIKKTVYNKYTKKAIVKINLWNLRRINKLKAKRWIISDFESKLRNEFLSKTQQFGTTDFYQNYPPLKITWKRPTASRFWNYWLENYIDKNTEILDIWWNIWFFSAYVSRFVKHIDLVEYNSDLVSIWKQLVEYEKIKNLNIINMDFKEFTNDKKYDIVFSFAIHKWIWMNFQDYISKLYSFIKDWWYLILETHIFNYKNWNEESLDDEIKKFWKLEIIKKWISDDHEWRYREFFILRK